MKATAIKLFIIITLFSTSLIAQTEAKKSLFQKVLTFDNVGGDNIIIIGLVEYDKSALKNNNIVGISLLIGSDEKHWKFKLPAKNIKDKNNKEYALIHKFGNKGDYELFYYREGSANKNDDYFLSNQEQTKIVGFPEKNIIKKFTFGDNKIINLGKLIVKYEGGNLQTSAINSSVGGNVNYTYKFDAISSDTTALHIFKNIYPEIYDAYKDDIFTFKSEFEKALEYVLNNIAEGKRLFLIQFIEENPNSLKSIFADLDENSQKDFATKIEKFTFEEMKDFLNSKK